MSDMNILEMRPDDLAHWLKESGEPVFRLNQIMAWIYGKYAASFDEMTNLSSGLREKLKDAFNPGALDILETRTSKDRMTTKYLFGLDDGAPIESVLMREGSRVTFCLSSQTGCALGCRFCATGAGGFGRNLSAEEILGQVIILAREAGKVGNIVFMGMGEPLQNLPALEFSLEALADERRFGLGERRITVSTAGIVPGIRRLAESKIHPNLALSLNSPFEDQRGELMPVNKKYPLKDVLEACEEYISLAGRRLLIEYVLLGGVNTSEQAAREVVRIARRLRATVNLIAFNPVAGSGFHPPSPDETRRFKAVLAERGIETAERFRRGRDIGGGCGQLSGRRYGGSRS